MNCFRALNKRHLLITGGKGVGKSTLLREIRHLILPDMPGIVSHAVRSEAVWLKIPGEEQLRIGIYDKDCKGEDKRMKPDPGTLKLAADLISRQSNEDCSWTSLDELGYIELDSPEYLQAIRQLMQRKQVIAAVRKDSLPVLQDVLPMEETMVVDLDRQKPVIGCVLMASGLGKRYGGNKLMADLNGKPLAAWAMDTLKDRFRCVVVTRHPEVAELAAQREIPCVLHSLPFRNDTVRLGLEKTGDEVQGCLFCPADQPLISGEMLDAFETALNLEPEMIWRPEWQNVPGSPVMFPRWAFEELKHLPEGTGGNLLVKKYPDRVRRIRVQSEWELKDVDTPEDLIQIKALLASK